MGKKVEPVYSFDRHTHACPKCGADIRWACPGQKGHAYCANSITATRTWKIGEFDQIEICDWEGFCQRRPDGKVEIYYYP